MKKCLLSIVVVALCSMNASAQTCDALVVGMNEGLTIDDCHTFTPPTEGTTTVATVTVGNDGTVTMAVAGKGGEATTYYLDEEKPLETSFARTFTLKANQDPDNEWNYYSTFFTSERAYKVPATATAYIAEVVSGTDTDELKLTSVGDIIPQGEAVILRAEGNSIALLPSARQLKASSDDELENALEGTDKQKTLSADQYALSLGQAGVGFYLWDGKTIGANKAYLSLSDYPLGTKALTFRFDDGTTTAIEQPSANGQQPTDAYDLNGIRVNDGYKGFVIKDGMKFYRK